MRDSWYGDNRDLIKWGGIKILCDDKGINKVLWVAYLREDNWSNIKFDDRLQTIPLPDKVIHCFKSIRKNMTRLCDHLGLDIILMDDKIGVPYSAINRKNYTDSICEYIEKDADEKKVVFLDPDTGLQPLRPTVTTVSRKEAKQIWDTLKDGDYLVFYQHRFRNDDWREIRKKELAQACGFSVKNVRMWLADGAVNNALAQLAKDVVFYFVKKDSAVKG